MTTRNHDDETITRRKARTISLLGAAVLALVVSGCGGGGGGGVATTPTTKPSADVPTLAKVYSSDTPQNQPLDIIPVGLPSDTDSDTTTSDDLDSSEDLPFVITSIRRSSGGGYDITGHNENSPDDEVTVQFLPEHCNANAEECHLPRNEDGIEYYLWTMFTPTQAGNQLSLTSDYDYLSVLHFDANGLPDSKNQRNMMVFGVGTPASAIPTRGEATYQTGFFRADAYRHSSRSNSFRQRLSGSVRIVANFDMSSLSGKVFSVRGSVPGSSTRVSWPTSSFSITDGQINSAGQFTATLTGLDSNSNTPFSESVRGFVGQLLGQFFGPNAEELGGVVSASRDVAGTDDDRNLYGYIASKQFGPSKTLGSTGFIASILRDFQARTSQLQESTAMAMVERTASGWRVTTNGRMIELSDSDFGSNPQYPYSYVKSLSEGEVVWLWTLTEGFWRNSEFDNFDVKGWALSKTSSSGRTTSSTYDYIVHGDVTSSSAMPTSGTATYDGRMEAIEFPSDDAISSTDSTRYRGDVALTADFANAEVDGVIDDLESRVGSGSYSSADGGATFNAEISGSNITATDLSGTGDLSGYQNGNVRGAFFGPSAEEAAGVFDAQDQANNKILTGWFGTAKGTTPPAVPPADVPTLAEVYSSDSPQDQSLDIIPVGLTVDFDSDTTTSDDLDSSEDLPFVITSIRRSSGGGYDITGHNENSPDDEVTVQFLPEHCNAEECHLPRNEDGIEYYLWTEHAPYTQQLSVNSEFDYLGVLGFSAWGLPDSKAQRKFIVFGVGTPAAAVPTRGEAIYHGGRIWANTYRQDSSSNNSRQRISGSVRIVANFDMSSLSGTIFSVRGSEPGSRTRVSWSTSSFSITNGKINSAGQFTATLTGLDSNPNAPFSESVRGFVGQILGQFFGPNAEELGGVASASRNVAGTDDDRNLYGYIASRKIGPSKTLGSTGFIAGILSDFSAGTSQLRGSNATAMVERTESGWTATVNGREFEWSDSDIGRNPQYPNSYLNPLSDGEDVWLWTYTRGFWKNSEFNHFDVKGWSFEEKNSPEDYTSSTYDYIVHGDVTSSSAMPTSGSATYDGRMRAVEHPTDDALFFSASTNYRGDVELTADFANAAVTGVIDNLQSRVGFGSYSSANGGATFSAEISGSNITSTDLSGTGDLSGYQNGNVRGAFFGPAAEEAAGVFDAQDQTNNKILAGWFGTAKDE